MRFTTGIKRFRIEWEATARLVFLDNFYPHFMNCTSGYNNLTIKALDSKCRGFLLAILFCVCVSSCYQQTTDSELQLPDKISFNFDIRPILSNNCYVCHGPDSSTRQADLRLDLREFATRKLADDKRAIVPGKWTKSELIRRVSSDDPEVMMPPPEMKRHISEREIALLKRWINEGAKWEPYWAFMPPTTSNIPEVNQHQFVSNEIDNFVVRKLEDNQLVPAEKIERSRLARRLSFTLTGLPPNPEIVQSFSDDESPEAYEKLIDHYLSSQRFGEHWARHWMDLVRYADTRGHEFDYVVKGAWQYRDYLIRAFNRDVPYDQLVKEQLAGDLLENPRYNSEGQNESVIGTAFYCLSEGKHSPVDLRIDQSERIDNIIDVTSKTFQALTVSCAKCHDHKFDPIPTTDYYALYGMVESTRFTLTQAGFGNRDQLILDSLKKDHEIIKNYISENISTHSDPGISAKEGVTISGNHRVIGDFRDGSLNDWTPDGIAFTNSLGQPIIDKNRVVGLQSGSASSKVIGKGLFGVLRSPGFVISEDSMLFSAAGKNSVIRVIIDNHQLIQNPIYGQLQTHVKTPDLQDYKIDLSMWKGHHAYIELLVGDYQRRKDKGTHNYDLDDEAWLEVEYIIEYDSTMSRGIADINSRPRTGSREQKSISEVMQSWIDGIANAREVGRLSDWFSINKPVITGLNQWNTNQQRRAQALYDSSFVVGVTDGDHIQSPVFIRGSLQNLSEEKVPHRFLTAVSDTSKIFKEEGSGRLEMANQITNSNNPLTARVMVNRIWHHVFGRGIVETVDNFGVQGKIPSHPDLLDFLAVKFIEDGWSVKKITKYMVLSQAFQRVTEASDAGLLEDPDNLLLQHYPVRRINAESLRDAILATSGELDTAMFGPAVPVYLTEFLTGRGRPKQSGPLDGDGRRSVYQSLNRNFLPPMMLAFDMPVPFSTFGRRNVSNVPSQSLTLLNDPFIQQQAGFWAARIVRQTDSFEERVKNIYLIAFSRIPSEQEIQQAQGFFEEQRSFISHLKNDQKMEQELWKSYCHSIFNLKEFIFLI